MPRVCKGWRGNWIVELLKGELMLTSGAFPSLGPLILGHFTDDGTVTLGSWWFATTRTPSEAIPPSELFPPELVDRLVSILEETAVRGAADIVQLADPLCGCDECQALRFDGWRWPKTDTQALEDAFDQHEETMLALATALNPISDRARDRAALLAASIRHELTRRAGLVRAS